MSGKTENLLSSWFVTVWYLHFTYLFSSPISYYWY